MAPVRSMPRGHTLCMLVRQNASQHLQGSNGFAFQCLVSPSIVESRIMPVQSLDATSTLPAQPAMPHAGTVTVTGSDTAAELSRTIEKRLGPGQYARWFSRTRFLVEDECIGIEADSRFVAQWISRHFTRDLSVAVNEIFGRDVPCDIRSVHPPVERGGDPSPPATGGPVPVPEQDALSRRGTPRHDRHRSTQQGGFLDLDSFVVGTCNRLAYSAARQFNDAEQGVLFSPLFIHGSCGLGKTHILQGICREAAGMRGSWSRIKYITGEQFTNEFITSLRHKNMDRFRTRMRNYDLLAIDDVHFLANKLQTQKEFLHTLDSVDLSGARIVLASDGHPRQIKSLSEALVSRFLSGMVVELDMPDRATRLALVHRLADARNLPIQDSAAADIARRCLGSVRELEGLMTRLSALHHMSVSMNGEKDARIGRILVDQLFRDHDHRPVGPIRIQCIVDTVCRKLEVPLADLLGRSRHRRIVLGRALIAFLGRELTTHSYPEIALSLGRKYHSTVHAAEARLKQQLADNVEVMLRDDNDAISLHELLDTLRNDVYRSTSGL